MLTRREQRLHSRDQRRTPEPEHRLHDVEHSAAELQQLGDDCIDGRHRLAHGPRQHFADRAASSEHGFDELLQLLDAFRHRRSENVRHFLAGTDQRLDEIGHLRHGPVHGRADRLRDRFAGLDDGIDDRIHGIDDRIADLLHSVDDVAHPVEQAAGGHPPRRTLARRSPSLRYTGRTGGRTADATLHGAGDAQPLENRIQRTAVVQIVLHENRRLFTRQRRDVMHEGEVGAGLPEARDERTPLLHVSRRRDEVQQLAGFDKAVLAGTGRVQQFGRQAFGLARRLHESAGEIGAHAHRHGRPGRPDGAHGAPAPPACACQRHAPARSALSCHRMCKATCHVTVSFGMRLSGWSQAPAPECLSPGSGSSDRAVERPQISVLSGRGRMGNSSVGVMQEADISQARSVRKRASNRYWLKV